MRAMVNLHGPPQTVTLVTMACLGGLYNWLCDRQDEKMEQPEVLPPMWIGIHPPKNLAPERYAAQVQCQPCFLQPYLVVPSKGGQRLRIAMSSHIAGEPSFAISIQNGHKQDGTRVQGIPTLLSEMPKQACVAYWHCGMQRSRAWCGTPPILGVVNMVGTRNFTCYMGAL